MNIESGAQISGRTSRTTQDNSITRLLSIESRLREGASSVPVVAYEGVAPCHCRVSSEHFERGRLAGSVDAEKTETLARIYSDA